VVRSALIGAAGAVGALARYHLQGLVHRLYPGAFPLGTFVVNISGCFVLGVLFSALTERFTVSVDLRTALTVGFLGRTRRSPRSPSKPSGSVRQERSPSPF